MNSLRFVTNNLNQRSSMISQACRSLSNLLDYSVFQIKKTEKKPFDSNQSNRNSDSNRQKSTRSSSPVSSEASAKNLNKKLTKFLTKYSPAPRKISSYFNDLGIQDPLEISFLCEKQKILLNNKPVSSPDTTVNVNKSSVIVNSFSFTNFQGDKVDIESPIVFHPLPLLSVFTKPLGMQSAMYDPQNRPCFEQAIREHPLYRGMHQVGRLDSDTSGLILFSSSGPLTNALLDPRNKINREYDALVIGNIEDTAMFKRQLASGIKLSDCLARGDLKYVKNFNSVDTPEEFEFLKKKAMTSYRTYHNTPLSEDYTSISYIKLSTNEGKNRVVRRMLFNAGFPCLMLHRSSFGPFKLNITPESFTLDKEAPVSLCKYPWAYNVRENGHFYTPDQSEFLDLASLMIK